MRVTQTQARNLSIIRALLLSLIQESQPLKIKAREGQETLNKTQTRVEKQGQDKELIQSDTG